VLLAFLPGYALLWAFYRDALAPLERGLLAVGVSFALTIILFLLLALAGLPLTPLSITITLGLPTLLLAAKGQRDKNPTPAIHHSSFIIHHSPFAFILFAAACLRMINIHYSDLQGDEADILLRAVSLLRWDVTALLTHSKGPGEILVLAGAGALNGQWDEQTARLLFALAGTVSVGLIVLLGRELLGEAAGVTAGLLAAVDGVFVSYARTAQYQSLVLLLTLSAMWLLYRFAQGAPRKVHLLAAFLLAASCLVHFETILLLPVAGYLTLLPFTSPGRAWPKLRAAARQLWPAGLLFGGGVALFYVPFVLHPNVSATGVYLENRISGGSLPPFNNVAHFFYFEALKYNSAYYVALFNLCLLIAAATALRPVRGGYLAGGLFLIGLLASFTDTGPAAWLLLVGAGAGFGAVILSRHTALAQRVLWLWIGPPFLAYFFLVNRPGKHHYLFLAALTLLVGAVAARIGRALGRRTALGLGGLLLLIFAGHSAMLFLWSDLEYVLTYPRHKSIVYPTDAAYPYGSRIGFGYPFRLGWQAVGQLRRTGHLDGPWAGNDAGAAPTWYMLGVPPTPCYPRYVLRGEITYKGDEDFDVPFNPDDFGYRPRYRIWGRNGLLRLTILEFDPDGLLEATDLHEPARFEPAVTTADFTAPPPPPSPQIRLEPPLVLGEGSELKANAPPAYLERAQQLEGRVALVGYDLEAQYTRPGSILPVTLSWQTQSKLSLRYKVFIHLLAEDGQVVAQADDFPACGTSHTNTWPASQVTLDRHLLKLPPELPPGDYALRVGMYEPELNLRLNYFDVMGNEQGNSLEMGRITLSRD
jgi:4-amino-4-deoxy-L-arabinose transferase-like glycosyltransferase